MTVAQIVQAALPSATQTDMAQMRVVLVSRLGSVVVDRQHWHRVRPLAGVHVVIRIVPGKNILRSLLQIVVSVIAAALGQYWVGALGLAGTFGGTLLAAGIGIGVSVLGSLLINALIPPSKPKTTDSTRNETYTISGWQNRIDPNGVVPDVMGTIRYAPPFAAKSYTEIVGDIQYIRAVFNFGYGGPNGVDLSKFQIGDTKLDDYDEVQTEIREGLASDQPLTLYPKQVNEENVGAELVRPLPRNDAGTVISGPSKSTPIIRSTGPDASGASIIVGFPAGLGSVNDNGGNVNATVAIRVRQRRANTEAWTDVVTLNITAAKFEGFYRQHTWDFPTRGRYDIEVERMTDEHTSTRTQSRSSWLSLQTLRPEYPLNFNRPLALVAVRVKATYQLNGALDNFNAIAAKRIPDWDKTTGTWIVRTTSNPASWFRYVLQSPANPRPVPDSSIDLPALQSWHEYCTLKGLKYDRVHDEDKLLREALAEVALAGRARQRHDGIRWTVVVDRPQELVIDHINPRNSAQFKTTRNYFDPPDGFRVAFLDATNDYKPAERLVPWPGHSGDITLTEALELPGKTDPAEIWREARRRMYEAQYRLDTYSVVQDGAVRVATRGDLVMGSFDVLERTQVAGRVKSVTGKLIELDEAVTMVAGRDYAIRFRVFVDDEDTIGVSVVRPVATIAGIHHTVMLIGDHSERPLIDDLAHFGQSLTESLPLVVTRVESGQDFASLYRLVDAAPIIDELTDEEVPPAWSGRVGDDVGDATGQPPAPVFTSIKTGFNGTGSEGGLTVLLQPGSGAIVSSMFRLQHRLNGATVWNSIDFVAADGGTSVPGYATGNPVQLRAAAISPAGVVGSFTTVVSLTIGNDDAPVPTALDSATISIGALLGGASILFSTSDNAATKKVQLYRSMSNVLNRATDAIGVAIDVAASRSYSLPDGDTTRANLLANAGFDSAASWTLGTGWTIGSGVATHAAGTAAVISQPLAATTGKTYRIAGTLSAVTAGALTPRLSGGSNADGVARSANGNFSDRLTAVAGNNVFAFSANSAFAGSVDNAVAFLETETCLPAGTHYYWLEPQNADGVAGPISGPFSVVIR
ncbi:phage tail protein [Rhizobium sp. Root708]|nr:phage tail protein [Rhizobium sp. Root708]